MGSRRDHVEGPHDPSRLTCVLHNGSKRKHGILSCFAASSADGAG